jgi:4-hydroxybenzoate polyprenyltransferase
MPHFFKADKWWVSKIIPLMGFAFLGVMHSDDPPAAPLFLGQLLLFLFACFGIGAFGHLFLDTFDQKEDRRNGKCNLWLSLGNRGGCLALIGLVLLGWLPWWWLPNGGTVRWLVAGEFTLFAVYAVPPLRLKERGLLGVVVDGLYAHVFPTLMVWSTFAPIGRGRFGITCQVLLVVWLLPMGMRHLLCHQYDDLDPDRAAGVRTFAVRHGRTATLRLVAAVLLPIELAAMLLTLAVLSWPCPLPLVGLLAFAVWEWRVIHHQWLQPAAAPSRWRPIEWSDLVGLRVLDIFVQVLLTPLGLVVMLARLPALWPVLLFYGLLAGPRLASWWDEVSRLVPRRFAEST